MAKDQQDRELWEQQPGESGTLFAHFVFYRDMRYPKVTRQVKDEDGKIKKTTTETVMDGTVPYEKRSLRKTAEALGMNKRTIANQSAKWDWVRRCEARGGPRHGRHTAGDRHADMARSRGAHRDQDRRLRRFRRGSPDNRNLAVRS